MVGGAGVALQAAEVGTSLGAVAVALAALVGGAEGACKYQSDFAVMSCCLWLP